MSDHMPFRTGPFRLSMGLVPLDLCHWIEPDADFVSDLVEKRRLLDGRHEQVFAALPPAEAGSAEVLELLTTYLPDRFPTLYQRFNERLDNLATGQSWNLADHTLHQLDLAGRLVQEDLCLMQQEGDSGTYNLVGASVCFPTRWRLAEKIGKSVREIHTPVPGYEAQLASTMDRFLSRLKTERPVWRRNWSLVDDPALFQPTGHGRRQYKAGITADNAGETLWLRMERQTLRRLPRTGDILFTIRVHIRPLVDLATRPERAETLSAAIRALPPTMQNYKSLPPFLDAVLAWLDRVAATAPSVKNEDAQGATGP